MLNVLLENEDKCHNSDVENPFIFINDTEPLLDFGLDSMLMEYIESVDSIFMDFSSKNVSKHLDSNKSKLDNIVNKSKKLLRNDGILAVICNESNHFDTYEVFRKKYICLAKIEVVTNPSGRGKPTDNKPRSVSHTVLFFCKSKESVRKFNFITRNKYKDNEYVVLNDILFKRGTNFHDASDSKELTADDIDKLYYILVDDDNRLYIIDDNEHSSFLDYSGNLDFVYMEELKSEYEDAGYVVLSPVKSSNGLIVGWRKKINDARKLVELSNKFLYDSPDADLSNLNIDNGDFILRFNDSKHTEHPQNRLERVYYNSDSDDNVLERLKSVLTSSKYHSEKGGEQLREVINFGNKKKQIKSFSLDLISDIIQYITPIGGLNLNMFFNSGEVPCAILDLNDKFGFDYNSISLISNDNNVVLRGLEYSRLKMLMSGYKSKNSGEFRVGLGGGIKYYDLENISEVKKTDISEYLGKLSDCVGRKKGYVLKHRETFYSIFENENHLIFFFHNRIFYGRDYEKFIKVVESFETNKSKGIMVFNSDYEHEVKYDFDSIDLEFMKIPKNIHNKMCELF